MSIEIFEKAVTGRSPENFASTIVALLADAGFSDISYTMSRARADFNSSAGVYGCNAFSADFNNTYLLNETTKFIAVKDASQNALIVYPNMSKKDTSSENDNYYYSFIITNGVTSPSVNKVFSLMTNITGGTFKTSLDTSEVLLTPFIDSEAKILRPFYISANRVMHNINTVVTDSNGNSFTSLGNLFYIKNA